MGNNGSSGSKYHFVCFRCDRIIEPGERMHTLSASIETPTEDGSVGVIVSQDISCLCGDCASVLLAEAAIGEKLTMPPAATEGTEEEVSKGSNEAVLSSANSRMKRRSYGNNHYNPINQSTIQLELGRYFLKEGDYDPAIVALTKAIELDPDNLLAYDRRGIAHGRKYEYDDAIVDFTKAIEIDDRYAGAYNNRALSLYKKSMLDEAITDYNKAIELSPDIAIFYANRGLAQYHKGEFAQAVSDYSKAIMLEPADSETYNDRGEAYLELREYEKASVDFTQALALKPNDITAYANRASILRPYEIDKANESRDNSFQL
jgi:tetratricopeptide (TPR) repeat protein